MEENYYRYLFKIKLLYIMSEKKKDSLQFWFFKFLIYLFDVFVSFKPVCFQEKYNFNINFVSNRLRNVYLFLQCIPSFVVSLAPMPPIPQGLFCWDPQAQGKVFKLHCWPTNTTLSMVWNQEWNSLYTSPLRIIRWSGDLTIASEGLHNI